MIEHVTEKNKLQRLAEKDRTLTQKQTALYERMKAALLLGKPLQYLTGASWFMGKAYKVNEQVLIPRPETEELVQWIASDVTDKKKELSILDIGTGSGCIAIALKLLLPRAAITSIDISAGAIAVAKENAAKHEVSIRFIEADMTDEKQWDALGKYDIIVSNPPYIPIDEKAQMHINVLHHEPATALFVPGNDPLFFYRFIADMGKKQLNTGGSIYCELHRDYAMQTKVLFHAKGYTDTEIRKDMNGHLRMVRCKTAG